MIKGWGDHRGREIGFLTCLKKMIPSNSVGIHNRKSPDRATALMVGEPTSGDKDLAGIASGGLSPDYAVQN
jgi:hypothetical protein